MLENDPLVEGISLPNSIQPLIDCEFVDDTDLYLAGNLQNLINVKAALTLLSLAPRARINWDKSTVVWVSHEPGPFDWGLEDNLKWLKPGEMTRYLGFMISFQFSDED